MEEKQLTTPHHPIASRAPRLLSIVLALGGLLTLCAAGSALALECSLVEFQGQLRLLYSGGDPQLEEMLSQVETLHIMTDADLDWVDVCVTLQQSRGMFAGCGRSEAAP